MQKNLFFFAVPMALYFVLYFLIQNHQDTLILTLLFTTVIWWAIAFIPEYQVALIFLFTAWIFSVSSKEVIFSGFASSAFWLVFAGMLISSAIKNVALTERFSPLLISLKQPSYLKILISIAVFALAFSFIMPSGVNRIVLFVPIAMAIAKNFGFEPQDKGYTGILLTFIMITSIPAFTVLPSNVPNMILSGLTYELYGYEILYSQYLWANFVVLGALKAVIILGLIYVLYKDTPKTYMLETQKKPFSKEEKTVVIIFSVMLLFWLSDFIHGISPTVIAIVGVLFLAYPSIGIINNKDVNALNMSSLLFVAALISFGNIASHSVYIKELLTHLLTQWSWFDSSFMNYMALSVLSALSGVLVTQPTIPALFTPMAEQISQLTGFSLFEVLMIQVAGFSTVIFPFQMPPLMIGLALANIAPFKMIRVLFYLFILTVMFLLPLEFLWLQWIN